MRNHNTVKLQPELPYNHRGNRHLVVIADDIVFEIRRAPTGENDILLTVRDVDDVGATHATMRFRPQGRVRSTS